jgi:hypothetical protein
MKKKTLKLSKKNEIITTIKQLNEKEKEKNSIKKDLRPSRNTVQNFVIQAATRGCSQVVFIKKFPLFIPVPCHSGSVSFRFRALVATFQNSKILKYDFRTKKNCFSVLNFFLKIKRTFAEACYRKVFSLFFFNYS